MHVHKTAGEAVAVALEPHLSEDDVLIGTHRLRELRHRSHGLGKHSTARQIRDSLGHERWRAYSTAATVRDPVDRLLSLYSYFAHMSERYRPLTVRSLAVKVPLFRGFDPTCWPGTTAYIESESFSDFIRHPALDREPGAAPQTASLCDESGDLIVDWLAHYESIDNDVNAILKNVGLPAVDLPVKNASTRTLRPRDLGREDRVLLAERYADDYQTLGYPAPDD